MINFIRVISFGDNNSNIGKLRIMQNVKIYFLDFDLRKQDYKSVSNLGKTLNLRNSVFFHWCVIVFVVFQMFFIDHNKRLTTFLDPRLPTDVPPINTDFLHTSLFRTRGARVVEDSPRNHSSVSTWIKNNV